MGACKQSKKKPRGGTISNVHRNEFGLADQGQKDILGSRNLSLSYLPGPQSPLFSKETCTMKKIFHIVFLLWHYKLQKANSKLIYYKYTTHMYVQWWCFHSKICNDANIFEFWGG